MPDNPRPILETLPADPVVFDQVKQLLLGALASQNPVDEHSKSAGQSGGAVLESMFGRTSSSRAGATLDVAVGGVRSLDQLDVFSPNIQLPRQRDRLEAIVRVTGRPPLLVQHDNWVDPIIPEIKSRLDSARPVLQPRLMSVGRIDILNPEGEATMIGTGWLVDDNILVTNAHVAGKFAKPSADGTRFEFTVINDESVVVDLKREHMVPNSRIVSISKVIYIAPEGSPHDIALLQVEKMDTPLPDSLQFDSVEAQFSQDVAAIGYPAYDPNNDTFVMLKYFENVYEVKRLSPGRLIGVEDPNWIEHDCTTLGGSSGSAVINVETGNVVGLHFAGSYKVRNLAVKASFVKRQISKL